MAFIPLALKQTAVEYHRLSRNTQDVAGPGDFTRGADELDLHGSLGDGELSRVRARGVRVADTTVVQDRSARCASAGESSSFAVGLALKNYRQALLVLRHHRRFPPAAHALVEQIGKRILILARVSREPVDDRLVFFHGREDSSFPPMATTPPFANLTLVRHPLVQHKITLLRDRRTPAKVR